MIPVIYHSVANRIVDAIAWGLGVRKGFITDEEVKILDPTLGCKMAGLRRDSGRVRRL
jgi:hypothetical protein